LPVGVPYIPNDIFLDRETQQMIMITQPICLESRLYCVKALIVLLAQMGAVPADSVRMGTVDKIFTEWGSDIISMGESTLWLK
jgi:DNA mismatch repair protein MutS